MAIVFADGTQNSSGKIVQVKAVSTNTEVTRSSSGYIWGTSGDSTGKIPFDMIDQTNNKLIVVAMLSFGRVNNNGGMKLLVNGAYNDGSSNRYWHGDCTSTFAGDANQYQGAWTTTDDSFGCDAAYGIGQNIVIRHSNAALPSGTFYLGWYWSLSSSATGEINFNTQDTDNNGMASSSMIIYEVEDIS